MSSKAVKKKPLKADEWTAAQLVEQLAPACRDAYMRQRSVFGRFANDTRTYEPGPRWDGGMCRGRKYEPIWPKIAAFMLRHKLNPFLVVRVLFVAAYESGHAPYPNAMMSQTCLGPYADALADSAGGVAGAITSQSATARRCMLELMDQGYTRKSAALDILSDDTITLSNLFCYCLARAEGLSVVADKYLPGAVMQFLGLESVYMRYWNKWLPKDFVELVQQLYGCPDQEME